LEEVTAQRCLRFIVTFAMLANFVFNASPKIEDETAMKIVERRNKTLDKSEDGFISNSLLNFNYLW
jgi:hypothetical protein